MCSTRINYVIRSGNYVRTYVLHVYDDDDLCHSQEKYTNKKYCAVNAAATKKLLLQIVVTISSYINMALSSNCMNINKKRTNTGLSTAFRMRGKRKLS